MIVLGFVDITTLYNYSMVTSQNLTKNTEHFESNELLFKEHPTFNEQSEIPGFFYFFDSLKISCIQPTNFRPSSGSTNNK